MTDKHTAGPWYIRTNRHPDTDGRPWGWLDAAPPGGPQRNIPGVTVTWTRGCTSEANARLIAAAPDLLAALRGMLNIGETKAEYDAAIQRAVDAIAKATGEGE